MAIDRLPNPNSAAKISDLNDLIEAINAELPKAAAAPVVGAPENVFNALANLTDRQRKEVWRMLRDGK